MKRIVVIGTSGSGKSTLARAIAQRRGHAHIELDALHWRDGWRESEHFREDVARACAQPEWALDGNYSVVRDLAWGRADTIIWLRYDFSLVLRRITTRTLERSLKRQNLWGTTNRETLGKALSRDSIIWWSIKTWAKQRRAYPVALAQPEHAHLRVLIFETPEQTERFLHTL